MIKPTKPGRANRIADQIQRDVAELIQKEVSNPKTGLVTLTGCEITPDYAHATIYFTSIGSTPEEATEALNGAAQLHFVYDKSVERGFEMDQLIRQAREEDGEKVKGE